MRCFLSILLICCCLPVVYASESKQPKTDGMETREKTTELNYYENPRYKGKPSFFVAENGSYIYHSNGLVDEYTVPSTFQFIQRTYRKDGSLERKAVYNLAGAESVAFYDEGGFLVKERHFDSEWDKVRPDGLDCIPFLEKEGWFDRSTGQTAFEHRPFPPETGELTFEIFKKTSWSRSPADSTKYVITLDGVFAVPKPFLKKYGKRREDGCYYLEYGSEDANGALSVSYVIDIQTNKYSVEWNVMEIIE